MLLYLLLLIMIGASNSPTVVYYWHRMFDSERWAAQFDQLFTTCLNNSHSAMHCISSRALEIKVPGAFQFCHQYILLMASFHLFLFRCSCDSWVRMPRWERSQWCSLAWASCKGSMGECHLRRMKTEHGSTQVQLFSVQLRYACTSCKRFFFTSGKQPVESLSSLISEAKLSDVYHIPVQMGSLLELTLTLARNFYIWA